MDIRPRTHHSALAALITASRLTKTEVAFLAGIAPSFLADLMYGRRPGRDPELRERLARALGVSSAAITSPDPDRQKETPGDRDH